MKLGRRTFLIIAAILFFIGPGSQTSFPNAPSGRYTQRNLASDAGAVAGRVNTTLVNPWGMARSPSGHWWVADRSSGTITAVTDKGAAYAGRRGAAGIQITSPRAEAGLPSLTGIVYNSSPDFVIAAGKPARLIIASEDGTLWGWNPQANRGKAVLAANKTAVAVYKGVTIGRAVGGNRLYAANFLGKSIDVFDTYFHEVRLPPGAFADPELPAGYAPHNVQELGGRIYVAYALQDSDHAKAARGAGFGSVTVFDVNGRLISRLKSGPELNAPWGMALAPSGFGKYGSMLLVGNTGDGTIAVYDPADGEFKGRLEGTKGSLITIQGLRSIAAGRGSKALSGVFFCAGIEEGEHGLFGLITPSPDFPGRNPGR